MESQLLLFATPEMLPYHSCQHSWRLTWDGRQYGDECENCKFWEPLTDPERLSALLEELKKEYRHASIWYQQYEIGSRAWVSGVEAAEEVWHKKEWVEKRVRLYSQPSPLPPTPSGPTPQSSPDPLPIASPTSKRVGSGWVSETLCKGKYKQYWFNWEEKGAHHSKYVPTSKLPSVSESIAARKYWWDTLKLLRGEG